MNERKATIIVHSGNFDRLMSAFIIGNGFLSIGIPVTIFFTFWGLMALKKRGFERAPLSRMDFFGLGRFLIKRRMKKYNVASLDVLVESFRKLGGKIVACSMTMQLMGLAKKDLREEIIDDYGTVGTYCLLTKDANITLFI